MGGVVQLITRRAPGLDARLEGGSNEYLRGSAAGGGAVGPLFASGHGNLRRGEGEVDNDFFDGEEVALRLDGALGESATLGALVRWGASDVGIPYDYAGVPTLRREQAFETTSFAVPFAWTRESWHVDAQAATTATDLAVSDPDDPFAESLSEAGREQARLVVRRSFGDDLEASVGSDWDSQQVGHGTPSARASTTKTSAPGLAFGLSSPAVVPLVDAGVRRATTTTRSGAETKARWVAWRISPAWRLRAT